MSERGFNAAAKNVRDWLEVAEARLLDLDGDAERLTRELAGVEQERSRYRRLAETFRSILEEVNRGAEVNGTPVTGVAGVHRRRATFQPRPQGRYIDVCGRELARVYPGGLTSLEITERLRQRGEEANRKSVSSALSTMKGKGLAAHREQTYTLTNDGTRQFGVCGAVELVDACADGTGQQHEEGTRPVQ
jgi:hypothetical protein